MLKLPAAFLLPLLLLCACMIPAVADEPDPIQQFVWRGLIADRVGQAAMATPDGAKDLCFQALLALPAPTTIEQMNIYLCDERGVKLGEFWLSKDYHHGWILGVVSNGKLLNDAPGKTLGTYTGPVIFDLHGADSGRIPANSHYLLEVIAGGKTSTKILKADTPAAALSLPTVAQETAGWPITGNGTLTAPKHGTHDYRLHVLDATVFPNGGVLTIEFEVGKGKRLASVDLFGEKQAIPTAGIPASLARAYDLAPGTKMRLTHAFTQGERFRLGFEGTWFSEAGSTNTYNFTARVMTPDGKPATPVTTGQPTTPTTPGQPATPTAITPSTDWPIKATGALAIPKHGAHNYRLHTLDTTAFPDGGILVIEYHIGTGKGRASIDLYGEKQAIATAGVPVSLAHAYDIAPGANGTVTHKFARGERFRLGIEGNWFSEAGWVNTYSITARVLTPDGKPATPATPKAGLVLDTTNKATVRNIPIAPTFTIDEPHYITFIMTYHYLNHGALPGTIALRHADGTIYGPWQAKGRAGQGGVPNANWDVWPNIVIKAGTYTVVDSDPNTWSVNEASQNRGHTLIEGYPARPRPADGE